MTDYEDQLFMKFINVALPTIIGMFILGISIAMGTSLYNIIINHALEEILTAIIIIVGLLIVSYGVGYVFLKLTEES